MPVHILIATDLHQRAVLYEGLAGLVRDFNPDALILGGDFLHGTGMSPYGRTPQLWATECGAELAKLEVPVFFVRGNHEDQNWYDLRSAWKAVRLETPSRLNGDFVRVGELGIIGFPCAMGQEEAFSEGHPLGGEHYSKWLNALLSEHGDAARQLWIMHEPPTGTLLSAPGSVVEGHLWWRKAIEEHQPKLVICGHDHQTPMHNRVWRVQIGESTIVNVGQNMDGPLHATLVESDSQGMRTQRIVGGILLE